MKHGRLLARLWTAGAIAVAIVAAAGAAAAPVNQSVARDAFGSATPGVRPVHLDDALLSSPRPTPELAASSVRNVRPDGTGRALRSLLAILAGGLLLVAAARRAARPFSAWHSSHWRESKPLGRSPPAFSAI